MNDYKLILIILIYFIYLLKYLIMKHLNQIIIAVLTFFLSLNSYSQLYAKNSNIYVADNFVYVKGNINLDTNGNILLRNESQLLQGKTTTGSNNTGTGKLSIFQEGTSNEFNYNYWCSPIGNASAAVGNENFGVLMLNRPTGLITSTPATANHVGGSYDGTSNPLNIEPWFIYKYQVSGTYADWIPVTNTASMLAGQGFTMKGTNGIDNTVTIFGVQNNPDGKKQRYDFRGKPNDGDITINLGNGLATLTGNPYPSAIDLSAFLTDATTTSGIAYFWESNKLINSHLQVVAEGGYGTYSPVSRGGTGIYVPAVFYAYDINGIVIGSSTGTGGTYKRFFCPVGQGFMVYGNGTGTTATMKNNYRVFKKESAANQSEFERNKNLSSNFLSETPSVSGFDYTSVSKLPTPQIRFKTIMNQLGVSQMSLAFDENATDNIDFAKDAPSPNTADAVEVYFNIEDNPYVIDVINFDITKKIPIGLRNTQQANFKISVHEILNFSGSENVYIHDKIADQYFDIINGTFNIDLPAGDNKNQYEITFTNTTTNLAVNIPNLKDFDIYQNNNNQLLTINNPKGIVLKEVDLFDLSGKLIFSKTKLGLENNYKFSTAGLTESIYVVKIITNENEIQGKKISIFKSK